MYESLKVANGAVDQRLVSNQIDVRRAGKFQPSRRHETHVQS